MQVCNVPDPSSFSDHISISHKHADKNHSDLLVLGKIWKDRQKCAVCNWWSAGCYLICRCLSDRKRILRNPLLKQDFSNFSKSTDKTEEMTDFLIYSHFQLTTKVALSIQLICCPTLKKDLFFVQ